MLTNEDIKRIKKVEDPAKRIEELEGKCRTAGRAMIELNLIWEATLGEVEKLKADLA